MGAPQEPSLGEWVLPIEVSSTQSPVFPEFTQFICIKADENCAIAFGENPVAKPDYKTIDAGERLYYGVHPGHKLAVIAT
jgi:hypothetical protein